MRESDERERVMKEIDTSTIDREISDEICEKKRTERALNIIK